MNDETTADTSEPRAGLGSGDWQVDPDRSRVHFHTRAMFGMFPVRGRFERFEGVLHVDAGGRAGGALRIEAGSIHTGIPLRDAHLRTAAFFHAKAHTHLVFDLDAIVPDGDGYEIAGTLRIRDRTLPIRGRASVETAGAETRIRARLPVDHDAAGLRWAKPGMVPKVVDADIDLALVPEGSRAG